jgi:hypothetical protein
MDSDSDYDAESVYTIPSTYIEPFSIQSLTRRVEEFQRMHQLEAIEKLAHENWLIQRQIVIYQKQYCWIIDVLEEAHRAMLSLQRALEYCIHENMAADQAWLEFRGTKETSTGRINYGSAGWI